MPRRLEWHQLQRCVPSTSSSPSHGITPPQLIYSLFNLMPAPIPPPQTVCENDSACASFAPRFPDDDLPPGRGGKDGEDGEGEGKGVDNMVCYKGGLAVEQNYQMCDVTSMLLAVCSLASRSQS